MGRFALWWVPAEPAFSSYQTLINDLATKHNAPHFAPHITGFSGDFTDRAALLDHTAQALEGISPFPLSITAVAHSDNFFQTLTLRIVRAPELRDVAASMGSFYPDSAYQLDPHLSLLYAEMDESCRARLCHETRPASDQLQIDRVWLMRPTHPQLGWRDIGHLEKVGEFLLGDI